MTKVSESSRRAARALGERLARVGQEEPRRASFTDVGTIESVLADGTALVSYRGGTIGPLPMTCDCVCAAKGRSCVIAIDGPIVRVIGIVARSSTDFEVPATSLTGTLPMSHGGTGATTAASARASLGLAVGAGLVTDGTTLSVDNGAYVRCSAARRLFTGSAVRTVGAGADSVRVFTDTQFKDLFGRSISTSEGDFVGFLNGDAVANDAHVEGSSYVSSDKSVYAVLNKSRSPNMNIRLNYLVVLV